MIATIPDSWMPEASMSRLILHWTAGAYRASDLDRKHYHAIVESNGNLVRGIPPISGNSNGKKVGATASHTLNCNTGSIGISMACMAGAIESPFNAGKFPMTREQWEGAVRLAADLCTRYKIPVTDKTVLSHAEVQPNLGIQQRGKWDVARIAFDDSVKGARACGDKFRSEVKAAMSSKPLSLFDLGEVIDGGEPDETLQPVTLAEESIDGPMSGAYNPITEAIQTSLTSMGYFVGLIDGRWGGKTSGEINAFMLDRGLPGLPRIDDEIIGQVEKARISGFTRPIAKERAEAKPEDIKVIVPEVQKSIEAEQKATSAERLGFWGSVTGAFVTVSSAVTQYAGQAIEWLNPVRTFFTDLPTWVWFVAATLIIAALYIVSREAGAAKNAAEDAKEEATKAFNTGARS